MSPNWDPVTRTTCCGRYRSTTASGRRVLLRAWFRPDRRYELVWDKRRYPPKAILGTAYEIATGLRLAPGDFEGGKSGAVKVLGG